MKIHKLSIIFIFSFCLSSFLQAQGNQITGTVKTENNEGIFAVTIKAVDNQEVLAQTTTDEEGNYILTGIPDNSNFTVIAEKTANPLNGVSTFDLVMIRRHIIGVALLDSPYTILAADVNSSNTVTTFDMVLLRRLILAIIPDLGVTPSWRFVHADMMFPNPTNPWEIDTVFIHEFQNFMGSANGVDFIGFKMGDVNGSAIPNN